MFFKAMSKFYSSLSLLLLFFMSEHFCSLSFGLLLCFILETTAWKLKTLSHIGKLLKDTKIVQPGFKLHTAVIFILF